jgi:hypothetical protein
MITTLSVPISRIRKRPCSFTCEMWPTQIQPLKMFSTSQSSTAGSVKAFGGSIVACSSGFSVSETWPGSSGREGVTAGTIRLLDFVVKCY